MARKRRKNPAPALYAGGAALVAPYANPGRKRRRLPARRKNGQFRKTTQSARR